MDIENIGSV